MNQLSSGAPVSGRQNSGIWSMCPRGPVYAGEKEAPETRRTWPQTLMPPLTSSVTSGSHLTSPSLRVLLRKIGIVEPALPNSQVVERIK